ncbi:hypothetical protein FRX31_017897 [Thalictrum thalictroides]|uniref:Uncharacterized protein n=1 Tax=Thalictrum thalictroides TaxID=46969 RepID=A0A7J6W6H6_THATH|nr:hypothetical protein FRX31_017897 [Thalictrum thalictroides]
MRSEHGIDCTDGFKDLDDEDLSYMAAELQQKYGIGSLEKLYQRRAEKMEEVEKSNSYLLKPGNRTLLR